MTKLPEDNVPDDTELNRAGLSWPFWVAGLIVAIGIILAAFGR